MNSDSLSSSLSLPYECFSSSIEAFGFSSLGSGFSSFLEVSFTSSGFFYSSLESFFADFGLAGAFLTGEAFLAEVALLGAASLGLVSFLMALLAGYFLGEAFEGADFAGEAFLGDSFGFGVFFGLALATVS